MFSITFIRTQPNKKNIFRSIFKTTQDIFFLKTYFNMFSIQPIKHCFMFTKTKKSILAITKYWRVAPYLISFKRWITPFIERKSRFVKGAFPLRSNDNHKGPLIHDQINWKSSFHIVSIVVIRTKSLFLHMYLKMWSTIFLLLFWLEWNAWNCLVGKFLQSYRRFFIYLFIFFYNR